MRPAHAPKLADARAVQCVPNNAVRVWRVDERFA